MANLQTLASKSSEDWSRLQNRAQAELARRTRSLYDWSSPTASSMAHRWSSSRPSGPSTRMTTPFSSSRSRPRYLPPSSSLTQLYGPPTQSRAAAATPSTSCRPRLRWTISLRHASTRP